MNKRETTEHTEYTENRYNENTSVYSVVKKKQV